MKQVEPTYKRPEPRPQKTGPAVSPQPTLRVPQPVAPQVAPQQPVPMPTPMPQPQVQPMPQQPAPQPQPMPQPQPPAQPVAPVQPEPKRGLTIDESSIPNQDQGGWLTLPSGIKVRPKKGGSN
jgi:hypothetical protein